MHWLFSLWMVGTLAACAQLGMQDPNAGAASGGASGATGNNLGGGPTTGTNCGVDPSSGISLCLGLSRCPTVRVDPDQFPDCGFRISGAAIDLECLCGDSLCPMGSAASCLDAKALLSEQSAQGVCARVADGQCEQLKQTAPSSSSTCDRVCRDQCSGVPGCVTLCGC